MRFEPPTDRERIYAALVDWEYAMDYIREPFADLECSVVCRGIRVAKINGDGAETVTQKILAVPGIMWSAQELLAVAHVTQPGVAWFRELIRDCGETPRGAH